jgi:hypothetical protein
MMPVEIEGNDPGRFFLYLFKNIVAWVFNPFHTQVNDLGGNVLAVEKIGQPKKPHGKEIDPNELVNGPIIILQLGDMEEETVHLFHRGEL